MERVQTWYADKLDGLTFHMEGPVPQICHVDHEASHYEGKGGWGRVIMDVQHCGPVRHNSSRYVWMIYIDAEFNCANNGVNEGELGRGGAGIAIVHASDLAGLADPENHIMCPGWPPRGDGGWAGGAAHELGHALGLLHPPGCDAGEDSCDHTAMMQTGFYDFPDTYLTDADKAALLASPWIR